MAPPSPSASASSAAPAPVPAPDAAAAAWQKGAPKSADPKQLRRFETVLERRRRNLTRLGVKGLETVHDLVRRTLVTGGGGCRRAGTAVDAEASSARASAAAGRARVAPFPHPNLHAEGGRAERSSSSAAAAAATTAATTEQDPDPDRPAALRKNILHGLSASFYVAIDPVLAKEVRRWGLESAREVLKGIDAARSEARGKDADARDSAAAALNPTATASEAMGAGASWRPQLNGERDRHSDDEVIALDAPPPRQRATESFAAAGAAKGAPSPAQAPKRPPHRQTSRCTPSPMSIDVTSDLIGDTKDGTPTYSASRHPRPECTVGYDSGRDPVVGAQTDEATVRDVAERLERFEPLWDCVRDITAAEPCLLTTATAPVWGLRTAPVSTYQVKAAIKAAPGREVYVCKTAVRAFVRTSNNLPGVRWGASPAPLLINHPYQPRDRRCLVRMLPLFRTDDEREKSRRKRADMHLWPIGTFLQANNKPIHIRQRKQESHDLSLWKGMCEPLDVTHLLQGNGEDTIEVVARDDAPYALQVAICDYVGPDALFARLMKSGTSRSILRYDYDKALAIALDHARGNMVVLDSDDENADAENADGGHHDTVLTLSLICPITMAAMMTPVRGKSCRHIQCFDLKNWLHSNVNVSGNRWRCGVCEEFVSMKSLVWDGMFDRFLATHREEVSAARDKVQLKPDGTWTLMEENKLRHRGKKRGSGQPAGADHHDLKRLKSSASPAFHEVIELDDD